MMKVNFGKPVSTAGLAIWSAVATASIALAGNAVSVESKRKHSDPSIYSYGPHGPNSSYQSGPHTRIYVTKRSWLDAGTEVLPGDRKFTDYAFPSNSSFARENGNHPLDRQPLNPQSDMGGYVMSIPLP